MNVLCSAFGFSRKEGDFIVHNMNDVVVLGVVHDDDLEELRTKYNKSRIGSGLVVKFICFQNFSMNFYSREVPHG